LKDCVCDDVYSFLEVNGEENGGFCAELECVLAFEFLTLLKLEFKSDVMTYRYVCSGRAQVMDLEHIDGE
jgi:hypothetical protein